MASSLLSRKALSCSQLLANSCRLLQPSLRQLAGRGSQEPTFREKIISSPEERKVYPGLKKINRAVAKAAEELNVSGDATTPPPPPPPSPTLKERLFGGGGASKEEKKRAAYPGLTKIEEAASKAAESLPESGEDANQSGIAAPLEASRRFDRVFRAAYPVPADATPDPQAVTSAVLAAAQSAGLSPPSNPTAWSGVSLADPVKKFGLLTECARRLGRSVPNPRLAEIASLADALGHFCSPPEAPADPLKRLAGRPDLPPNVHVQVEPIRFTDNPGFFGGVDAFPGRDSLVTQPWARAKYRSKIAPPMRSPKWSGVGRSPENIGEMSSK